MTKDIETIRAALEIAIGYPALVAKGVGNMPILKHRAQDDCSILSDALEALSRLESSLSASPPPDNNGWNFDMDAAPKDGSEVMLYYLTSDGNPVPGWRVIGHWRDWAWFKYGSDIFLSGMHKPIAWRHLPDRPTPPPAALDKGE